MEGSDEGEVKESRWFLNEPCVNGGADAFGIKLIINQLFDCIELTGKYVLAQRSENKFSFKHEFVRNDQPLMRQFRLAVEQDVKINCPGPFVDEFDSLQILLNLL